MRTSVSLIRGAVLVLTMLVLGAPQPAGAQFGKRLKDAIKRTAEDKAIEKATTKEGEVIDAATGDAPAGAPQETAGAPAAEAGAAGPAGEAAAAAPAAGEAAPTLWLNYDFVPGDRVLYYSDYSEDEVGNFPERLEFQSGNMEVAELGGQRYLRASAVSVFSIPLPEVLPERFTIEIDVINRKSPDGAAFHLNGGPKRDLSRESTVIQWGTDGVGVVGGKGGERPMTNDDRTRYRGNPAQLKILGDGKYLKVFLDERRLANIPNTNFARAQSLTLTAEGMSQENPVYIGKIRVAASRKSIYDDLAAKGRISTQGILFATGSDQVRPESGATLKEIAEMMKGHPDLRIRIVGHTDNVGKKDANLALSERRAAAVKALLEKDFQIDGARMESQGFGDTQPAAKNDTPEGRQNNRRVELVRL